MNSHLINARIARVLINLARFVEAELIEIMEVGDSFETTASTGVGFQKISTVVTVRRDHGPQLYVPRTGEPIPGSDIITRFIAGNYVGQITRTGALRVTRL